MPLFTVTLRWRSPGPESWITGLIGSSEGGRAVGILSRAPNANKIPLRLL
jgi:hypothetical protein